MRKNDAFIISDGNDAPKFDGTRKKSCETLKMAPVKKAGIIIDIKRARSVVFKVFPLTISNGNKPIKR